MIKGRSLLPLTLLLLLNSPFLLTAPSAQDLAASNEPLVVNRVNTKAMGMLVHENNDNEHAISVATLREMYSKPQMQWPIIETADGHNAASLAPITLLGNAPDINQVKLGEALFFDTLLSKNDTVSCASCHDPRLQFGDRRRVGLGIHGHAGKRNTPNIFGLDHWESFFWDGRVRTAQAQSLMPIKDPIEMDLPIKEAVRRINKNQRYREMTTNAFNTNEINAAQLAQSLVAFQRTIELPDTRYSKFIAKAQIKPQDAVGLLSDQELKGMHLFRTKAKCMTCHQGALLSDNKFHVTGLHFYGRRFEDLGRYNVTKKVSDVGKFRTASLLIVSHTGPWMHNGLFEQFDGIVNFYNNGGARPKPRKHVENDPLFPITTDLLPKLGLTNEEMADLVVFLEAL
jgi:cytochrome c peroxidase